MHWGLGSWICAWLVALFALASHAQTPPGTLISNVAQGVFTPPAGVPTAIVSNTDTITTVSARTPSATQILHFAPGFPGAFSTNVGTAECSASGTAAGPFAASPNPTTLLGAPINLGAPVELLGGGVYHQGEPVFVRVVDSDQNTNALTAETILVAIDSLQTGDVEVLRALETGPNSGEFIAYFMSAPPPPVSGDCRLSVVPGDTMRALYTDPADATDSSSTGALVDPLGTVFDSATGAPVDGALVTLIDSATGLPASVLGDDGVSTFPSTVPSGGSVTDSGGAVYNFPPGGYRFPLVPPGLYRLQVAPPASHVFPSLVADAALQLLPGAPWALGPGSRGNDFLVPIGPPVQVDVPLDPANASGALQLTKRANRATAGVGEFVQYVLTASAPAGTGAIAATIEDVLPHGFRFERGSLRIGGAPAPDPTLASNGRSLLIPLGPLGPGTTLELRYVARVGASTRSGRAVNAAVLRAGALASREASATVLVVNDLLNERATLLGRVMEGSCDSNLKDLHAGIPGVRVFLEDGTSVITDEQGRFHFPLVFADTHVVQLDTQTVPEGFVPARCNTTRFAGRAYSQFVEPQRGSLWRADFFLEQTPNNRGLHQQVTVTPQADRQQIELRVSVGGATLNGVSALVMLPEGVKPLPGSIEVDGTGASLDGASPAPTVRAPRLAPGEALTLRFAVAAAPATQVNALARAKRDSGDTVQTPVVKLALDAPRSYTQSATWEEDPPPPKPQAEELPPDAAFGDAWLATAQPANAWLYPPSNFIPKIPSVKIGVQHDPALRVRLFRNGELVSPLNFDGIQKNAARTVAVSRWRGVDLSEGPNVFLAELLDASGGVVQRIQQRVHASGPPARGELMPTLSELVADGRTVPVVAVRLLDRWGQPVREGMSGPLKIAAPHRARGAVERARNQALSVTDLGADQFVVGQGGIARIELEPSTTAGRFALTLQLAHDHREEIEGWLRAGERAFTLVGLATGARGFGDNSGSAPERRAAGITADAQDGRIALFTTGTVRKEWQVTAAYDTDAKNLVPGERLQRSLDPDEHFTLYGDGTEERYEAPSSDGIYLKVQRDRFYGMYGDFETALSETELARYERIVTGLRSEYYGESLRWNAFATETGQSFARDEIRGNGTSGLYRLSQAPIVIGSARARIEVRDRFRPDRVLESRPLVAQLDFDIDPYAGTLFFREAVAGRDEQFNPVFIVVEYEVDGQGDAVSGGGRVAGRWLDGALELGTTGVHEGRGTLSGDLVGVDATYQWSEATKLHAEWAGSDGEDFTSSRRGLAWLVSAEHRSERAELLAYAREQESGFGLGQLSAIDQGARRIGVDGRFRLREAWNLLGSAFHEENLGTNDDRQLAESVVEYEKNGRGAHVGARYVHDSAPLASADTGQLLLGGHQALFSGKVNLRAGAEAGFGSEGPHGDYSDRLGLGADYKATDWLTLFADHEVTFGDVHRGQDTRVGMSVTPWEGGLLSASFGQKDGAGAGNFATGGPSGGASEPGAAPPASVPTETTGREYGPRTYANLGIAQHWNLLQNWGFDFSVDRSQTLSGGGVPPFDADVPIYSGATDDDYTAISLGAGFSRNGTAFTSRVETRMGELEDQWNFTLGALREHDRTSYAGHAEVLKSERSGAAPATDDTYAARLSLAYRPLDTRFILLEQVEYEHGLSSGGGLDSRGDRVLNHFKLNYQHDERTQISWQYSAKWVGERIDGDRYESLGHLFGIEARHDVADGWDVALYARARQLAFGGNDDGTYSVGASIGRRIFRNTWASVGYNVIGFEDEEFSRSDYTAQGPFMRLRIKVDQDSVREWLGEAPRLERGVRNLFTGSSAQR
ncbi:MAG TPA: hypothetical protein VII78_11335 [Myxococcota bacterium]